MDSSARPKLTIEEYPQSSNASGIMQPRTPQRIAPSDNAISSYLPPQENLSDLPLGYTGESPFTGENPRTVQPTMYGQPIPSSKPLYDDRKPQVVMRAGGGGFSIGSLRFVIPALLIIAVLVGTASVLPRLLNGQQPSLEPSPEPTLIPATPVPTPDILPRTRTYFDLDKEITFDYLGSFTLVECDKKITFTLMRPSDPEKEICQQQQVGVLEILLSAQGVVTPFEGYENSLNTNVEGNDSNYLVVLLDQRYKQLYDKILESVQFIDPDLTQDWEEYSSSAGYRISYPPVWTIIPAEEREGSKITEIRKNVTDTKLHNLAIKVTSNVSGADVSTSEIIASLQQLSGWKESPTVEFRVIGGETAHVLQGEYEGTWKVNVVVWRGTSLVEMTWQDRLDQSERTNFEGLLSTFRFI